MILSLSRARRYNGLLMGSFADAIQDTDACGGACPPDKPVCGRGGACVAPTCERDARPYCHNSSVAGIRARQMCPEVRASEEGERSREEGERERERASERESVCV